MLNPTPAHLLGDARNRPYFLWDSDIDFVRFRELLADPGPEVRGYFLGKLMRQAKPDDVFQFASVATLRESWPLPSISSPRWRLDHNRPTFVDT